MRVIKTYISILFLLGAFAVSGQTYDLLLEGNIEDATGPPFRFGTVDVYIDGAVFLTWTTLDPPNNSPITINQTELITSLSTLQLRERSIIGNFPPACDSMNNTTVYNLTQSIQLTITNSGCVTNMSAKLIPNIDSAFRLNGTGDLCIGQQLTLGATAGFPSVAYNWQYSTDNGGSWTNFPAGFNLSSTTSATIEEIIGSTHTNFLETDILFRVGTNSKGAYSANTVSVRYSACAPLVTSLNYSPPQCAGDPVNVVVNFDRTLDADEEFSQISVVDATDSSLILVQFTDVSTDTPGGTTFTFSNVTGLVEGESYRIQYQMKKGGVLVSGFIESTQTFTFNDAIPVTFSATWTDVDCFGENTGSIAISANGGAGNYEYRLDTGAWTPFDNSNTHSITNLVAGNYQVRVRDANGCTEEL